MTGAFSLVRRGGKLLVSMPHVGTALPAAIAARLTDQARALPDTDWHVDRLYDFLADLDATVLVARWSRLVIDLNRPPDGASLYPGQAGTGLCPVELFDGAPVYRGPTPDDAEIATRRVEYWQPYHDAIAAELQRIQARHGRALLWDAHSIAPVIPRLFDGRLPDHNIGTARGTSCGAGMGEAVLAAARPFPGYSSVLNGRYVGGYITRNYGRPDKGIHAVQLELSQATYMDGRPSFRFDEARAKALRPALRAMMRAALDWLDKRQ
ncbi:MAG: N-formylglutamate deformylase [Rhodospirillales bacterium]